MLWEEGISGMTNNMYSTGEYIRKNPTLDAEDTTWKITKIIPLVDEFTNQFSEAKVKILDVGGGAGLFLKGISDYLSSKNIRVEQYALDLSMEMLRIQKENNPDIKTFFEGSIEKTSFDGKEIDLVLMIDVIEHVPDAVQALKELSRISKYAIFKVPLENNLYYNFLNLIKTGGLRRYITEKVGHINFYNFKELKKQIATHTGEIIRYYFTNVFEYYLSKEYHKRIVAKEKILYTLGKLAFTISPGLCSHLFNDFVVCLVKCK
jgi:ubiquinone/menaquinone biosynthesis C-methylase UbiE